MHISDEPTLSVAKGQISESDTVYSQLQANSVMHINSLPLADIRIPQPVHINSEGAATAAISAAAECISDMHISDEAA